MSKVRSRQSRTDFLLILVYLALVVIGLFSIYAAIYFDNMELLDFSSAHARQFIWVCGALIIGFAILILDGSIFTTLAYIFYAISIVALIAVIFYGQYVGGGVSWFDLGYFKLQPSEFAKFTTCLALSKYLSKQSIDLKKWRPLIISLFIIMLPAVLTVMQGDMGTAIVFFALILVLYRRGMHAWILWLGLSLIVFSLIALRFEFIHLFIVIVVIAGILSALVFKENKRAIPLIIGVAFLASTYIFAVNYAFSNFLKPHQQNRINVLLGKVDDLKGSAYNVYQSKIAIGSGGATGKGYLQGTQTKFNFVPELSTDFIFCTIGEEFGFIGSFVVVILFLVLLYRILVLSERQRSDFTSLYAYSVASIIFFHFFVNLGMTIGLVPVIGIPLPFISYGGSSLLGFTILLFILIKLDAERYMVLR